MSRDNLTQRRDAPAAKRSGCLSEANPKGRKGPRGAEIAAKVRLGEGQREVLRNVISDSFSGEWGDESTSDNGVSVLRTVNFTNDGSISYAKTVRRLIPASKVEAKKLCFGDIILEKSGGTKDNPVGRVVFFDRADEVFLTNNFTQVLRPDKVKVFPRYLLYVLLALYKMKVTETLYNKTTGIQNLQVGKYLDLQIPLPPLSAQRRIAGELDKICELKKNAETRLEKLDLLVKSRFVEMFGDVEFPQRRLSDIAEVTGGLTKNSKRKSLSLRYKYLRVANVFFNKLDLSEVHEIGVLETEVGKTLLRKDDLLFVEGNGSIEQVGRVALWNGAIEPCLHQNHLIKARFTDEVVPEYAIFYFMSEVGRRQIKDCAVSTTGLHTLSIGKVSNLMLPLPPLALQREFAAFVAKVDKLKDVAKKSVEQMDTLYWAKLQEYFG